MTAHDETLLASIPLPHGQLRDVMKAWTGAALELEALEDRKVTLTRQIEASDAVRPADALQARFRWIRAVHGLEANLELSEADATTLQAILEPLQEAAKKAERSKSAKTNKDGPRAGAPDETGAPTGAPDETGERPAGTEG